MRMLRRGGTERTARCTAAEWWGVHSRPGLHVRAGLPTTLRLSGQASVRPPWLLTCFVSFGHLLCAMQCSGFRGCS